MTFLKRVRASLRRKRRQRMESFRQVSQVLNRVRHQLALRERIAELDLDLAGLDLQIEFARNFEIVDDYY